MANKAFLWEMESHDEVSKKNVMEAAQFFYQAMERAEDGQYTVLSMAPKFVECIDATITISREHGDKENSVHGDSRYGCVNCLQREQYVDTGGTISFS